MRWSLLVIVLVGAVGLNSPPGWCADDESEIRPRAGADAEAVSSAVDAYFKAYANAYAQSAAMVDAPQRLASAANRNPATQDRPGLRLQNAFRRLAEAVNSESPESMLKQKMLNAESSRKGMALSKEEAALADLRFRSGRVLNGVVDEKDYTHGAFWIYEIGPIRLIFKNPDVPTPTPGLPFGVQSEFKSEGSTAGICTDPQTALSGDTSGHHGSLSNGKVTDVFAHGSEGGYTTLLIRRLPVSISRNVMKIGSQYFALTGKHAVIFMYDETEMDKVVVLEK